MVFQFFKTSYAKVKSALSRARSLLGEKLQSLFKGPIDESTLDNLEQLLYEADFGVQTAMELTNKVREMHKANPSLKTADYIDALRSHLTSLLSQYPSQLIEVNESQRPQIILIVGVNGNGKTTSVAKLANLFHQNDKKVLVAAADTFRAAAIEQLETWAHRIQVDIVKGAPKSDPAAVAFDAIQAAKARQCDIVLIDTAGRLHTKTPLMQELEKIKRACQKASTSGPHETLLVLDATTGQNAIDQAKHFHKFTPISGLILTKLDGTAKGGIIIAIQRELGIPVKFIGTGEDLDDLQPFDAQSFVSNLLE
ncbi:signal recognition particle-docking protein FtsY [Candidatus Protochlamydia phocaeensis]|uniref:signal recognition particle-docking protein FtsY n=1 Tax=Candidatus Protochlamydia phocaeensis TaxID=1414722 RepID=UPI000839A5C6|nr:signal recognition particle-docking protein FtsY [Candidatus Protochlamydia phocaeensis]